MDILELLHLQSRLVPDLFEKFNRRYELLMSIKINQPIGRKSLVDITGMTERQLRTECDILNKLGLLSKETTGMKINENGDEFLKKMRRIFSYDAFSKQRNVIKSKFGVKEVFVVNGDFSKEETTREQMVLLLFESINNIVQDGSVIGVSGGSTMGYVASKVDKTFGYGKNIIITPIRGALTISNTGYQSNDIATKIAVNSNNNYQLLYAPDNIGVKTLDELVKEPIVKNTLNVISNTSIIIHSIGDAFEMANRRKLPKEIIKKLEIENAKSEAFGSFYNINGEVVYDSKTIGMNSEDVKKVANIFTIVGGDSKADAVVSYLNSKPKNTILIIDEAICKKLINDVINI